MISRKRFWRVSRFEHILQSLLIALLVNVATRVLILWLEICANVSLNELCEHSIGFAKTKILIKLTILGAVPLRRSVLAHSNHCLLFHNTLTFTVLSPFALAPSASPLPSISPPSAASHLVGIPTAIDQLVPPPLISTISPVLTFEASLCWPWLTRRYCSSSSSSCIVAHLPSTSCWTRATRTVFNGELVFAPGLEIEVPSSRTQFRTVSARPLGR